MGEGTVVNAGTGTDQIDDLDTTGKPRLGGMQPSVPVLQSPATFNKLERTKVSAASRPGLDWGDADHDNPAATHDKRSYEILEALLASVATDGEADRERDRTTFSLAELLQCIVEILEGKTLKTLTSTQSAQHTVVTASLSVGAILLANPRRATAVIVNDITVSGAGNLYLLAYDPATPAVSTSNYTLRLAPGDVANMAYVGRIDCIWDVATGQAQVTDFNVTG